MNAECLQFVLMPWLNVLQPAGPMHAPPGPLDHRPQATEAVDQIRLAHEAIAGHGVSMGLFHAQPVADTAHRLQPHRVGGVALDLAAQSVDLHVDGTLADV